MNKIFFLLLLLVVPQLHAEDISASSEVVDPLAPFIVPETEVEENLTLEPSEDGDEEVDTEAVTETETKPAPEETPKAVTETAPVAAPVATPAAEPETKALTEADTGADDADSETITEAVTEEPAPVETAAATEVEVSPVPEAAPAPEVAASPIVPAANPMMSKYKIEPEENYVARQSHWLVNFGFEGMNYKYPAEFAGTGKTFKDQTMPLYGPRLGFGREFYMGAGFNTTTRLEAFYMGTLFESPKQVDKNQLVADAFTKRTGQIWGGEATQSLGFLFNMATTNPFMDEMSYLTIEPYIFAGIGRASAFNSLRYHNNTSTAVEDYDVRVKDSIASTSVGFGVNMTSITGFFLYLKATQYSMNITKRNEQGFTELNSQATSVPLNRPSTDVDPEVISIYALGGGYKF